MSEEPRSASDHPASSDGTTSDYAHGVFDHGEVGLAFDDGAVVAETLDLDSAELGEAVTPAKRPRRRYRGRLFARGSGLEGGFFLNAMSFFLSGLSIAAAIGVVYGLYLVAGWSWAYARPALDEWGAPFAAHDCEAVGATLSDPVLAEIGALFTSADVGETLRARFRAGTRIDIEGNPAVRLPLEHGSAVAVRSSSAPGGIGAIALRFTDKHSACSVVRSLGFPEGRYRMDETGHVELPFAASFDVLAAPQRGKIQELRLVVTTD